jgi:3-oxoacyl-[acyl-carrier protein] reductase
MAQKVGLVTGASRGVGREIAVALAESGYAVGVNYARSHAEAENVVATIAAAGGSAMAIQADVSDPKQELSR